MLTSQDRILTTHTGSLPRPAELTALYVQRRAARQSIRRRWTGRQGRGARGGGEADRGRHRHRQQRRAAARGVLPVRPPPHERLRRRLEPPGVRRRRRTIRRSAPGRRRRRGQRAISNPAACPRRSARCATWIARWSRPSAAISATRSTRERRLRRTVHDRPLPRHHRRRDAQRAWYNTEDAYLAALGQRAAGGIRGHRRARLPAADRRA